MVRHDHVSPTGLAQHRQGGSSISVDVPAGRIGVAALDTGGEPARGRVGDAHIEERADQPGLQRVPPALGGVQFQMGDLVVVPWESVAQVALAYAREHDTPHAHLSGRTHPEPAALDAAILQTLHEHQIDLVVTAGYMKKLGPATLAAYQGRILNIHPSLLPRHGGRGMYGMNVHWAVLAAGDTLSGASVHLVTADYDAGPVIAQQQVPVLATDTPQTLAARVLAAEHRLLPTVVRAVATQYSPKE